MTCTVIIGTGVAGVQTALELRGHGYEGELVLIGDESEEPYDRPPLSKEYLKGKADRETLGLLPARIASDRSISLRLGQRATRIQPAEREVMLEDGSTVNYDYLVIATGAHNRTLPVPGADLPGVWSLRRIDEAEGLRRGLDTASNVVIVGGGFIGLEVAAAARARGARVRVVEFLPRVMARVLSPDMSRHFEAEHSRHGVEILTRVGVTALIAGRDGAVSAVALSDGTEVEADIVVVGVGVRPAIELAESAGLETADGILVDGTLRTSDPHVYAVGDCARFDCVVSGQELRLESIQNAADQARFVAAHIAALVRKDGEAGQAATYAALPWFWTEQFNSKLQIAGVASSEADSVVRGDPATGSFSVGRFLGDQLVAVESVNQARDHLGARKLLAAPREQRLRATKEAFVDVSTPLKSLLDA
jgi:3-phenylpropionate/trans-cinnamate dioxygenase ferredoxin reductase component